MSYIISIQGMNDAKLRVYQFQHPLVCSSYRNTFDRQNMVDEGLQTIRQHRFVSSTISLNKMSTMYFHHQCLCQHDLSSLICHLTTFSSSFLRRQQHPPSHFIKRNNYIHNVITPTHTLTLLIPIKFLGDYLRMDSLDHYLTFKLNILLIESISTCFKFNLT